MSVLEFVKRYAESGRVCLPVPSGHKATDIPDWSNPERRDFIFSENSNIAWRLDGVTDIDLDSPEAERLAVLFLPPTGAKCGREGRPPGHWMYEGELPYKKYKFPDGSIILEIRSGRKHYTVVPPSLLPESKGRSATSATWAEDGPLTTAGPNLERRTILLATACALGRALGKWGYGHDARLEVAGLLLMRGVTEAEAELIGAGISMLTENLETADVRTATRSTAVRLAAKDRDIRGGPALAERIGAAGPMLIALVSSFFGGGRTDQAAGGRPWTELGDAETFADANAILLRHDHRRGRWLLFNGHVWAPQTDGEVARLGHAAMRARQREALGEADADRRKARLAWAIGGESRRRLSAMEDLARGVQPLADPGDGWDLDPWTMGAQNGVIDLKTGELRDGAPEDRITMRAAVEFDPYAVSPLWDRTITQIFGGDPDLIAYVDRLIGYSLTGDCREEMLAVCHGDGANGKGTLMNTLARVLGDYADNLPFSTFEARDRGGIPNDLAKLVGRRFVTSSESGEAARLNEDRIKAMTGRDPITARFLRQEFFTFQPVCKIWLATNHRPEVRDDSAGFWRRIHLIPFTQSFAGREDLTLKDRLMGEAKGILARAVRGCLAWQERGLDPPTAVRAASGEWRRESDPMTPFLEECCIQGAGMRAGATELYAVYLRWCQRTGVRDRFSQRAVGLRMRKLFQAEEGRHVHYLGIGLLDDHRGAPEGGM